MNIRYYLNFQIPKGHRQLLKNISQNPEYGKTHCNDLKNPFDCANRERFFYNRPQLSYEKLV